MNHSEIEIGQALTGSHRLGKRISGENGLKMEEGLGKG